MKRTTVLTAMVLGASMLTSEAMFAAPMAVHVPVNAMFGNVKTVKFSLHNNTKEDVKVKAGETEMTVQAGKTLDLKLPIGTKVVAQTESANYKVGEVVATAVDTLDGSTITLN